MGSVSILEIFTTLHLMPATKTSSGPTSVVPGENGASGSNAPVSVVEELLGGTEPATIQPRPWVVETAWVRMSRRKLVTLRAEKYLEAGETGASGHRVKKPATEKLRLGPEPVIVQPGHMVVQTVRATALNKENATLKLSQGFLQSVAETTRLARLLPGVQCSMYLS